MLGVARLDIDTGIAIDPMVLLEQGRSSSLKEAPRMIVFDKDGTSFFCVYTL